MPRRVREKWLERLFDAVQEDDPPYIESLGEHWGALCGDPTLASQWADRLLPLLHHVMADRRNGTYPYAKAGTLCYSALLHAGRLDELLAVLALDPKHVLALALARRATVDPKTLVRAARDHVKSRPAFALRWRLPHCTGWRAAQALS